MTRDLDVTHDSSTRSWVESANRPDTDFPIQNLPLGVFRRRGSEEPFRLAAAIGDSLIDLGGCAEQGVLAPIEDGVLRACSEPALNGLMALGPGRLSDLRRTLHEILRADATPARRQQAARHVVPLAEVELALPARVGDYTDFYASVHHATNVGSLFRPDSPLLPNYKYVPIAYHGRASSIVVSPSQVRRPAGQLPAGGGVPTFGLTRRLDYELEVGLFIGPGNELGEPIPLAEAERHMFGFCLVNDWSARDIQAWEYQPLGPFLAKSFATTVSPWVVTVEALAPFRAAVPPRPAGDPAPLPYLSSEDDRRCGAFSIDLEVLLSSERMRAAGAPPLSISRANFRSMYWTPAQALAHHTSNGCNLRPGDLLGSGTVSGSERGSWGCLLELTRGGREPLDLGDGEARTFLEDGDEVVMRGSCSAPGRARIGFGECRGRVIAGRS